jgi:hypothetical protein
MNGCWKLNKEALDGSLWRPVFRRIYEPVTGETGELIACMKIYEYKHAQWKAYATLHNNIESYVLGQ